MLRKSLVAIFEAARQLFRNWKALAIITTIYGLLLTALYVFVTTKESTVAQVATTVALALAIPVLFFILQTAVASYADTKAVSPFIASLFKNSWKLFVVSLPVVAAAILAAYLLNKLQSHFPLSTATNSADPYTMAGGFQTQGASSSIYWSRVAVTSLRYLLLGLLTPLALMHLWIAARRDGLIATFKGVSTNLRRAFAAHSVLIYMAGFVVFALLPYFILSKTTASTRAWLEIGLLTVRLAAVFCLTQIGWVVTVGALSFSNESASLPVAKDAE